MDCTTCTENTESKPDMDAPGRAAAATEQDGAQIRVEKVLDVKRRLMEGRYRLADKLDVVVDRLLEDLLGQGGKPHRAQ